MDYRIFNAIRSGLTEVFVFRVIGMGLAFYMNVLIAKNIDAEGYGLFTYVLALSSLIAILIPLGRPLSLIRYITQYSETKKWELFKGVIYQSYFLSILMSVLCGLFVISISDHLSLDEETKNVLIYIVILIPLLVLIDLLSKSYRALGKMGFSVFPNEVLLPALILLAMLFVSANKTNEILELYLYSLIVVIIVSFSGLIQRLPGEVKGIKAAYKTREWFIVSLPMIFGGLGQVIMTKMDVIMLGSLNDMDSVGVYTAATKVSRLSIFGLGVIATLMVPLMSRSYHSGDLSQLKSYFKLSILLSVVTCVPILVISVIWSVEILSFFGDEFISGKTVLWILLLAYLVHCFTGPVGPVLMMVGAERIFAKTLFAVAILNVIGNYMLIPRYGAVGAALVTAIGLSILNLMNLRSLYKHLKTS